MYFEEVLRFVIFVGYKLLFPITGQFISIILRIQSFFNKSVQILNKKYKYFQKDTKKSYFSNR